MNYFLCNFKPFRNKGFSLSEVIMALAIVGIIAALTVPSLVQNTSKEEYYQRFKSAYTLLDTATEAINAECNGNIKNCLSNPNAANDDATSRAEVLALYRNKLKVSKFCGTGTGCFADVTYKKLEGGNYRNLDNVIYIDSMILSNGISLGVDWDYDVSPGQMIEISIDLNGINSPNQNGIDTFYFIYNSNTAELEPRGGINFPNNCSKTSNEGIGCAGRIIKEGGINYW